ncbi:MAG TPA: amidohydrolase family protein [Candidatus Hydrogenedentes bacterium]|nr:amidohydrolase family protein [Candidatus Hydrogenedentota bacterium]
MYYVDRQKYLKSVSGAKGEEKEAEEVRGAPAPAVSEYRERMEKAFRQIPIFCQHSHFGEEKESLGWFFPKGVVGRTNEASMGLADGLVDLLDMPGDHIPAHREQDARQRYEAFCGEHSLAEYYDRICRHTRMETLSFVLHSGQTLEEAPHGERFKVVIAVDAFLFPLDAVQFKEYRPNDATYFEGLTYPHKGQAESLTEYLEWMRHALRQMKGNKEVVGVHWDFARWRSLELRRVSEGEAAQIYTAKDISLEAYLKLQDYLAFKMACCCGELGLPIQIAAGLSGETEGQVYRARPVLLEEFVTRPELAETRFVLVHGGYPFDQEAAVLARRGNVWGDFSRMTWLFSPRILANHLREWLEVAGAKKMLFGVDGSGLALIRGAWNTRRALAMALSEMVGDHLCTEREAFDAAREILGKNALDVYGLSAPEAGTEE